MSRDFEDWLGAELGRLASLGRLRAPDDGELRSDALRAAAGLGVDLVDASSNDYLGLAALDVSRETSVQRPGFPMERSGDGAGASRLIHGTRPEHVELERALAEWLGLPAALLFTSGYAANLGALTAVAGPDSVVFSDQLNHASIIDGCRLSRARVEVIPHLDLEALERALEAHANASERVVVTESYFSMDGDGPDLPRLRACCDRWGARLVLDEAHALGVFGPAGAGRFREAGITPDVVVGTLGKSVGAQGAFVAGSENLRRVLWNRARSFVFSTATSPLLARAALFHVERARTASDARRRVLGDAQRLRAEFRARNIPVLSDSTGPIVPALIGDNTRAIEVTRRVAEHGVLTQAIRPPTVPEGTARLRITVTARWPADGVERVAAAVQEALR